MALALEEAQEHFPKLVYAVRLSVHIVTSKELIYKIKKHPYQHRGDWNRGTTLIIPTGYLSYSVTGVPVPVLPGNAISGLRTLAARAHTNPLSLNSRFSAWLTHSLCIFIGHKPKFLMIL
jgi:hypothetical protein